MHNRYSVAVPAQIEAGMLNHLVRPDHEEDVLFALWYPSHGKNRLTALIHIPIYPVDGDRQRHGNASFNQQYFDRVCKLALENNAGIVFLHSHPVPGWQHMSSDDIVAEEKMMGAAMGVTDLPLLGMTTGSDGTWSARFWIHSKDNEYNREWCESVRSVGKSLNVDFNDALIAIPEYQEAFKRTATVWSKENHRNITRLRIGIVGLGSVGSIIAEILARSGFERISLIDFDLIKEHNLDRTLFATKDDIGRHKVSAIEDMIHRSSTAKHILVDTFKYSVAEKEGYEAALDCDVIFSCVDRPRARRILNHFAYAHLVPTIDGGICVRFKDKIFTGVDWQLQTASPERACLECLGVYTNDDVSTEIEGMLDDPSYIKGLPDNHRFRRNENVIAFSMNLASLEFIQLIALTSNAADMDDLGIQRFRYIPGILDQDTEKKCTTDCFQTKLIARGDMEFSLYGNDKAAEKSRM